MTRPPNGGPPAPQGPDGRIPPPAPGMPRWVKAFLWVLAAALLLALVLLLVPGGHGPGMHSAPAVVVPEASAAGMAAG